MAATPSARIKLSVLAWEVLTEGIKKGTVPSEVLEDLDLRNGTADGKIDLVYVVTETAKAASSTTTYALDGGVNDSYGDAITFAKVDLILLRNRRTTALAYLEMGPNVANGFGTKTLSRGFWASQPDRSLVAPASWYCAYNKDGVVVDATHSDLDITASAVVGDTNTWDLVILGRSA